VLLNDIEDHIMSETFRGTLTLILL